VKEYTFTVYFRETPDDLPKRRLFAVLDDMGRRGEVSYSFRIERIFKGRKEGSE